MGKFYQLQLVKELGGTKSPLLKPLDYGLRGFSCESLDPSHSANNIKLFAKGGNMYVVDQADGFASIAEQRSIVH